MGKWMERELMKSYWKQAHFIVSCIIFKKSQRENSLIRTYLINKSKESIHMIEPLMKDSLMLPNDSFINSKKLRYDSWIPSIV